jgi:hypothetical protein
MRGFHDPPSVKPSSLFILFCEELQLSRLSEKSVPVAGFGRENLGVLEFKEVTVVETMFHHRRFVCLSKPYLPVVLIKSGLNGSTSLPM